MGVQDVAACLSLILLAYTSHTWRRAPSRRAAAFIIGKDSQMCKEMYIFFLNFFCQRAATP